MKTAYPFLNHDIDRLVPAVAVAVLATPCSLQVNLARRVYVSLEVTRLFVRVLKADPDRNRYVIRWVFDAL